MEKIIWIVLLVILTSGCTTSNENIIGETKYATKNVEVFCDKEKQVEYLIVSGNFVIARYNPDGTISTCGE